MESVDVAKHIPPGKGESLWVVGELLTLKIVGEDTSGAFAVLEEITPPQGGPPPHRHSREDETFYVLEGELEFRLSDRTILATAGSVIYGPRDILHTFKNVGTTPSRMLVHVTPAGLENMFAEVGEPVSDPSSPPEGPPDIERLVEVNRKYGVEIPPPPEQQHKPAEVYTGEEVRE
jgi:quercetin dioxygenase-like cupin family protein